MPGSAIRQSNHGARALLFARVGLRRFRHVIPFEPPTETVKSGIERTLVQVLLVELVPDFPLQLRGHHDATEEVGLRLQPVIETRRWARQQREQCELVEDARVERRWLHEDHERLTAE